MFVQLLVIFHSYVKLPEGSVYIVCAKSLERPGMARHGPFGLFFGPGQVLSLSPKHQRLMTGTELVASRLQTELDMGTDQYL